MTTDTQLAPTDDEIDALNDQFRWDTAEGRRDLTRAVLARWGQPAIATRITVPTNTMEQEFQNYYRRGFEAGKKANRPAHSGEPVATVIKRGASRDWMSERLGGLPDGVYSLYLAPQPVEREPMTPEQRDALWESCKYDDGEEWTVDWEQIVDAVELHHGIKKGGQHGTE